VVGGGGGSGGGSGDRWLVIRWTLVIVVVAVAVVVGVCGMCGGKKCTNSRRSACVRNNAVNRSL
jgi:hypothetical protein